ncbi:T9SS type A sorting domain-containing protein [Aestuariivivens insulae]|uniref:T9SS type A sorting domain-containing protein n=1 Tax=Aestuariivivens insulae TaxID=1621988 RepID=UPI001F59A568|nr:T9SS type A sorting domain-containing protein [Aestuariivivens insulae]
MKKVLLLIALLSTSIILAQGDTIGDPITIVGTGIPIIDETIFNSLTDSELSPSCGDASADVFYKHDVIPGANKVTVGMTTSGLTFLSSFDYQIIRAINGDINNREEILCSSYNILIGINSGFTEDIINVDSNDDYYLRIRKPLVGSLTSILEETVIDFVSEYDPTLSVNSQSLDSFRMVVKENTIELINNNAFTDYAIYNLMGQLVIEVSGNTTIEEIDINRLNKGVYVVKFKGSTSSKSYKFIKQ